MDPAEAVAFLRERERYELDLAQKSKDGAPMTPATFRVSICPTLLRAMHCLGYFDTVAEGVGIEELKEEHLKGAIDEIAKAIDDH